MELLGLIMSSSPEEAERYVQAARNLSRQDVVRSCELLEEVADTQDPADALDSAKVTVNGKPKKPNTPASLQRAGRLKS